MKYCLTALTVVLLAGGLCHALEADEVLIVYNGDMAASERLADHYRQKRRIPRSNMIGLELGVGLRDEIGRSDYDRYIAAPVRKKLDRESLSGGARCLAVMYGVPYRVGKRGTLPRMEKKLGELKRLLSDTKKVIVELEEDRMQDSPRHQQMVRRREQLRNDVNRVTGSETGASVDSELSMIRYGPYELHRWQGNSLRGKRNPLGAMTMMVSRIDGPSYSIAKGLIDKALTAERKGLRGTAYVDSRGINKRDAVGFYDNSLRQLVSLIQRRTGLPVRHESTDQLFKPGTCPNAALYCGWYSLKNYVDAFEFVDGAVGYHIASFEAVNLRDSNTGEWCSSMLRDGITATIGSVAEPYLTAFPQPVAFFGELTDGATLVEAFYRTKAYNSWQMVLIGDPMYRPFKRP